MVGFSVARLDLVQPIVKWHRRYQLRLPCVNEILKQLFLRCALSDLFYYDVYETCRVEHRSVYMFRRHQHIVELRVPHNVVYPGSMSQDCCERVYVQDNVFEILVDISAQ